MKKIKNKERDVLYNDNTDTNTNQSANLFWFVTEKSEIVYL